jgi:hypothetical protein
MEPNSCPLTSDMRKRLITPTPQDTPAPNEEWLNLESAAVVEVTSEEKGYPVESALVSGETEGWRDRPPQFEPR